MESKKNVILLSLVIGQLMLISPQGALAKRKSLEQNFEQDEKVIVQNQKEGNLSIHIGLDKTTLEEISEDLGKLLADEYILFTKAYNYHWNVVGMNFSDLHALFAKQYEQAQEIFDTVAERIRALGQSAPGSLTEFLQLTRLQEQPGQKLRDKQMIKNLLDDCQSIIQSLRINLDKTAELNDMGTNNILRQILNKHEKSAWMLRSYLE